MLKIINPFQKDEFFRLLEERGIYLNAKEDLVGDLIPLINQKTNQPSSIYLIEGVLESERRNRREGSELKTADIIGSIYDMLNEEYKTYGRFYVEKNTQKFLFGVYTWKIMQLGEHFESAFTLNLRYLGIQIHRIEGKGYVPELIEAAGTNSQNYSIDNNEVILSYGGGNLGKINILPEAFTLEGRMDGMDINIKAEPQVGDVEHGQRYLEFLNLEAIFRQIYSPAELIEGVLKLNSIVDTIFKGIQTKKYKYEVRAGTVELSTSKK